MSEETDAFLAHYGILGMKWGHHKSEAEVIADRKAKREARAQPFVNKAAILQTRIDELKTSDKPKANDRKIASLEKDKRAAISDADAKRNGKLSSNQKKLIVGASIVAGLTAAYLLQNNIQSGEFTRLAAKGKALFEGEDFAFKKNPKLADPHLDINQVHDLVVKHVNPDYGGIGTKMNCRRSTFSYEMRRRGYDVRATKTTNANGQNVMGLMNATSPNGKFKSTGRLNIMTTAIKELSDSNEKNPMLDLQGNFAAGGVNRVPQGNQVDSVFRTLAKEPNGSRGELGVTWKMGGGHSMAYEIFNGKPVIFDAQTGRKYETPEEFAKDLGGISSSGYTRLDNIDLNHNYLMRWMTNAK